MQDYIVIKGAREHNLKNLAIKLPRNQTIVLTGPSGSGKSTLAIDTIYAEGQRRYVESLSVYARQFLGEMQRPDVDYIEGLSPSIAIEQKTISKSPRSTVGTLTEIYDYLRVLYTRIGRPFCRQCGKLITEQNASTIIDMVKTLPIGTKIQVLSPIVKERKGHHNKELQMMKREGFVRARIDGVMQDLTEDIELNKNKRHTIEIVIDRLVIKPQIEKKLDDAINNALRFNNIVVINLLDSNKDIVMSKTMACPQCRISIPEITPMFFSFNSNLGACDRCKGLGYENVVEETVREGHDTDLKKCTKCNGMRLNDDALSIKIGGFNIAEVAGMQVSGVLQFFNNLMLDERESYIARRILKEITDRLGFLQKIGLEYLTVDRLASTLSGGEAQRMRLATQIGSALSGVLYILDEPSIGLHASDCSRLIHTLKEIKDNGNTIIVVEHDEETIISSDYVVDMGPGAGTKGGWVIASGTPVDIINNENSLTGKYISGKFQIPVPEIRRLPNGFITITGACENNLKNLDVSIPLGIFTAVTGVSGSGKSTLIIDTLYRAMMNIVYKSNLKVGEHTGIYGVETITRIISVDQSPIGKTPRSNPATYVGLFTAVRELFAALLESRAKGYTSSRFSFNMKGGRCEECKGAGIKKYEMHFLPDAYVLCDSCAGKRFNTETLYVKYKGKNISEVLDMTVSEAKEFFSSSLPLWDKLNLLEETGLGYIRLGQSARTLSGGEAQRLKLSKELAKKSTGTTIYILDEPTTGLHFVDIEKLLTILHRLTDLGNTVIVIEHNLDIIKSADYVIDMGPKGGEAGGYILAQGTPQEISANKQSLTGQYLVAKIGCAIATPPPNHSSVNQEG